MIGQSQFGLGWNPVLLYSEGLYPTFFQWILRNFHTSLITRTERARRVWSPPFYIYSSPSVPADWGNEEKGHFNGCLHSFMGCEGSLVLQGLTSITCFRGLWVPISMIEGSLEKYIRVCTKTYFNIALESLKPGSNVKLKCIILADPQFAFEISADDLDVLFQWSFSLRYAQSKFKKNLSPKMPTMSMDTLGVVGFLRVLLTPLPLELHIGSPVACDWI